MQDTLQAIGEVAVTLVGFSALFRAFSRESVADGHSEARVLVIIEQGLGVVLLCFLPFWVTSFAISQESAYRASALGAALWMSRWLVTVYRLRGIQSRTPMGFVVAVLLQIGAFLAFAACAFTGGEPTERLYLSGLMFTFVHTGWTFLFQFRAENG